MRRLFLQGIAVLFAATCALFAWTWSEARVAFLVLGIIIGAPLWWFALKFPRPTRSQLHLAAAGAFIAAIAVAVLIPSTQVLCDCPPPQHATRTSPCPCPVDHHLPLRLGVAATGAAVASLLVLRARRGSHPRTLGAAT
jgi:hypothetical protein